MKKVHLCNVIDDGSGDSPMQELVDQFLWDLSFLAVGAKFLCYLAPVFAMCDMRLFELQERAIVNGERESAKVEETFWTMLIILFYESGCVGWLVGWLLQ
jgi:hypothetical protein